MKKSVKTTTGGVIACLGLLFMAVNPWFDGDPETMPVTEDLGAAVAGLGALLAGWFARDDNISSEGGYAKKDVSTPKK